MACDIPPHNLTELAAAVNTILHNDNATLDDILQHIQGPDFPTAGSIFAGDNREDLRRMYGTGRGGFTVRAQQHLEETSSGNRVQIVFTEIPYQTNKVRIIEQIAAQVRDKKIEGIRDLRDESDRHGMRLVVELTRDGHVQTILAQLYKATALQVQYSGNFVALVDNRPRTLTLFQLLREFIRHRRDIITRRTEFELDKARDRHHIVEGLLKAIDNIDAIIAAIRAAESAEAARDRLQDDPFDLSQRQAQAVLEMQLRRLAQLERSKLEEEYRDLTETIEYLEGLLADEKKIDGLISADMDELVETYGQDRRTRVIHRSVDNFTPADLVPHQSSVVTLTRHGYIKRQPVDAFRSQRRGGKGVKGIERKNSATAGDAPHRLIACDTHDHLLLFTSRGRVYGLPAHEVEARSREWRGLPVRNVVDLQLDEQVTTIIPVQSFDDDYIILGTRQGYVKKSQLRHFMNVRRSGLLAFNLRDDELVEATFAHAGDDVIVTATSGRTVRFAIDALREASRVSGGVRGINAPDESLIGLQTIVPNAEILTVTAGGFGKRTPESEYPTKGRAGKGNDRPQSLPRNRPPRRPRRRPRRRRTRRHLQPAEKSSAPKSNNSANAAAPPKESK